jgi:hypothetical protein
MANFNNDDECEAALEEAISAARETPDFFILTAAHAGLVTAITILQSLLYLGMLGRKILSASRTREFSLRRRSPELGDSYLCAIYLGSRIIAIHSLRAACRRSAN